MATVERLLAELHDPRFAVRKAAGEWLAALGAEAVPLLNAELRRGDPVSLPRILATLGETGAPMAAQILLDFDPADDPDLAAARWAGLSQVAFRLAPVAGPTDIATLVQLLAALYDRSPNVCVVLVRALERLTDTKRPELHRALPLLRRSGAPPLFAQVADAIAASPLPEPPPGPSVELPRFAFEIEALFDLLYSGDHGVRRAAGERLAAMGEAALPALAQALAERHPLACPRALDALAQTGLPAAVDLLVAFDSDHDVDFVLAHHEALERLAAHLGARPPAAVDTDRLIRLLEAVPPTGPGAGSLARALETLARVAPTPGLRAALRPLRGSLLHPTPPRLRAVARTIDAATAVWKDLPLPALSTGASSDLPLPSEGPDGA